MISVTPPSWQSLNSLSFCALEELVISGCSTPTPAQNNLCPPPEPVDSITGAFIP